VLSAITISLVPEARGGPFVFSDDLEAGCKQAAALGFDAVEIFLRSTESFNVTQLRQLLAENNLKLAAAGTGAGWVVHKLRLTDPDSAIRRRAREFVLSIIDIAGAFGAPAIIGSMQGRAECDVSREQALAWLGEALNELAPRAARHGVPLLIEPLNRYETNLLNNVEESLNFLDKIPAKNVKILCDLFHMNIEENAIAGSLRLAGARLGHVHFADSNRRAIGFGHTEAAPIIRALREIGFSGYLSAEILPLPDSLAAAKQTIASFRKWSGKS
jgi:sugar phosphate isomerase/epimerase